MNTGEWQLFQESVGQVRVIDQERAPVFGPGHRPKSSSPAILRGAPDTGGGGLAPGKPARKEFRGIKTGRVPMDGQIDLHGRGYAEAVERVEELLVACSGEGGRFVLIITGRGARSQDGVGVLRQGILELLHTRWSRYVIWAAEAPPELGGRGAIVVKLRKGSKVKG